MSSQKTEYVDRLPYGLWFDPESRTEHLFDRGYNAIASRSVDMPGVATTHPARQFINPEPGRIQGWFYGGEGGWPSPWRDGKTQARCERVLAYFCLGRDVRGWLGVNKGIHNWSSKWQPVTGGKYLPGTLSSDQTDALAGEDLPYVRTPPAEYLLG